MKKDKIRGSFVLLAILVVANSGFAQNQWEPAEKEVLEKKVQAVSRFFGDEEAYRVEVRMSSYKGHLAVTPHDVAEGYIKKVGKNTCVSSLGMVTVQDGILKVMVDTANRIIGIYEANKAFYKGMIDLENLRFEGGGNCFSRSSKKATSYRMEMPGSSPLERIEFTVDHKNFLSDWTLFYAREVEEENASGTVSRAKPKLGIEYRLSTTAPLLHAEERVDHYISIKGDKVIAKGSYRSFELVDFRVKK